MESEIFSWRTTVPIPFGSSALMVKIWEVFASTGLTDPIGVAFSPNGDLFVANRRINTIRRFSSMGVDLGDFVSAGLNFPYSICFDGAGRLYVADYFNNSVDRFAPDGTALGKFVSTLSPQGVAFDTAGNFYVTN